MRWTDEINWPAIRVTEPAGIIIVCTSEDELKTARYLGLKDLKSLNKLYVIGRSQKRVVLGEPRIAGSKPGLLKRWILTVLNPRVRIEFDHVELEDEVSLEEIKRLLTQNVRRYSEYWMEMDIRSPEDFSERINAAENMTELFHFLGVDSSQSED